jgi:two-component system LytT family sensor kinase
MLAPPWRTDAARCNVDCMPRPTQQDPTDAGDRPPTINWRVAFVLFTLAGLLRFFYFYLDDITRGVPGTLVRRALEESTGAYSALLLFPLIVAAERRHPLSAGRWRRNWPVHAVAYAAYTVAHTTLMALSRSVIYPLVAHGPYDYGRMPVRYFMESAEDVITYVVIAGILTFMRVQQYLRDREVRAATLERDAANARLEVLSLRLQPHFLFNALNTISSTVYEDPVAADDLIGRLGDLLRRALRSSERQEVTLTEELETLRAYLAFVEARFGDRVRCTLDAGASCGAMGIPPLLLQPLAENAVVHGSAAEFGSTDILIRIRCENGVLEAIVENTVTQPSPEGSRAGTGLGATRDRLRLLYGTRASLEVTVDAGRFRVTIRLPARPVAAADSHTEPVHARADR